MVMHRFCLLNAHMTLLPICKSNTWFLSTVDLMPQYCFVLVPPSMAPAMLSIRSISLQDPAFATAIIHCRTCAGERHSIEISLNILNRY